MGLFNRKKKIENFDSLPYLPDDKALPPLPPPKGMPMRDMPAMAPRDMPPLGAGAPPSQLEAPVRSIPPRLPPLQRQMPSMPMPKSEDLDLPELDDDMKIGDLKAANPHIGDLRPSFDAPMDVPSFGAPPVEAAPKKSAKVFVQLNKYREIVSTVNKMENRIGDLQDSITKIKDIRGKERDLIESWNNLLTEAKSKIEEVHRKLPDVDDY
jgi:hypothetical protein